MKDLSTVGRSMTSIIQNNHSEIDGCTSVAELITTLKKLFNDNNLDTPATKRLLANVGQKRNFTQALQTVYDSMLYGSNLGVNR